MFEKIRDILASQLDVEADVITPDTDIMEDLAADSLDLVEFITSLESEFGIMIPQDAVQDVKTVGQVVEIIEKMVG
ncbi:MAG: acyl carrier protein [Oscillospiraceae bacterium]